MKQWGLALITKESQTEEFSGYINYYGPDFNGASVYGSWVTDVLPYVEQRQLYDRWKDPTIARSQKGYIEMPMASCPSDIRDPAPQNQPHLAYQLNCGTPDVLDPTHNELYDPIGAPAGIGHNHAFDDPQVQALQPNPALRRQSVKINLDYVSSHDGTTYTMLLSEILGTAIVNPTWATPYSAAVFGLANINTDPSGTVSLYMYRPEWDLGVVYDGAWEPAAGVNVTTNPPVPFPPGVNIRPDDPFASPRSHHPGGANVYFTDGHSDFLTDSTEYLVWQHLVTPYGKQAGQRAGMSAANRNIMTTVFDPSGM
jgi:prepilin-type processing-associated H-X9-DG protein